MVQESCSPDASTGLQDAFITYGYCFAIESNQGLLVRNVPGAGSALLLWSSIEAAAQMLEHYKLDINNRLVLLSLHELILELTGCSEVGMAQVMVDLKPNGVFY